MNIAVAIQKPEIHSAVSDSFGKSEYFLFFDTQSNRERIIRNPFLETLGGAGIQTAQLLIENNADAIIVNQIGWNAFSVLSSAGIKIFHFTGRTANEAIKYFTEGKLLSIEAPNNSVKPGQNKKRKRSGRKNQQRKFYSINKLNKENSK